MKTLEIVMPAFSAVTPKIFAEDKPVKFEKSGSAYTGRIDTENDFVELSMVRYLDIGGALWFFLQLVLFVVSIFGLFDIGRQKYRTIALDVRVKVDLGKTDKLKLRMLPCKADAAAVKFDPSEAVQEESNAYYNDENAQKTLKKLKTAKILTAVAVVLAVAATLLLLFM